MYQDLIVKIKNAQAVKKESIKTPYNKYDEAVAVVLAKNNYVSAVSKKGRNPKRILELELKYEDGKGVVNGVKILSNPSRKLYVGYKDIKKVKQGYGILVLSTPKGIMTGGEARKQKLGGQVLFEIW